MLTFDWLEVDQFIPKCIDSWSHFSKSTFGNERFAFSEEQKTTYEEAAVTQKLENIIISETWLRTHLEWAIYRRRIVIAELWCLEGPQSGAPYSYRKPMNGFSHGNHG